MKLQNSLLGSQLDESKATCSELLAIQQISGQKMQELEQERLIMNEKLLQNLEESAKEVQMAESRIAELQSKLWDSDKERKQQDARLLVLEEKLDAAAEIKDNRLSIKDDLLTSMTAQCERQATEISFLQDKLNASDTEKHDLITKLEVKSSEKAVLELDLNHVIAEQQKLSDVIVQERQKEYEFKTEIQKLKTSVLQLEDSLKESHSQCSILENEMEILQNEAERCKSTVQSLNRDVESKSSEIKNLEKKLSTLQERAHSQCADLEDGRKKFEDLQCKVCGYGFYCNTVVMVSIVILYIK